MDNEVLSFGTPSDSQTLIKVIGVGGGGGNAVTNMYKEGIHDVSFMLCNTDRQALNGSDVPVKLLLGQTTTCGLGSGDQPERGRKAAEESEEEIRQIHQACSGRILKVIIETCLLTEEEKIKMCEIVTKAGAEYIKTSTGFSTGGATFADVELMRKHVGKDVKVKAAGGISSFDDAEEFIRLGAERLGTSRLVKIMKNSPDAGKGY